MFDATELKATLASLVGAERLSAIGVSGVSSELDLWRALRHLLPGESEAMARYVFDPRHLDGFVDIEVDIDVDGMDASPTEHDRNAFVELAAAAGRTVHGTAALCAALSDAEILCAWDNDDERTFVVARCPTASGHQRVWRFNERSYRLDDEAYESIAAFCATFFGGAAASGPASNEPLPAWRDPPRLAADATWLLAVFGPGGFGDVEDFADVATVDRFDDDLAQLGDHPALAVYWLCHHFFAGNDEELEETLAATDASASPLTLGARELFSQARAARTLEHGCLRASDVQRFRAFAPPRAFVDPDRARRQAAEQASATRFAAEQERHLGAELRAAHGVTAALVTDYGVSVQAAGDVVRGARILACVTEGKTGESVDLRRLGELLGIPVTQRMVEGGAAPAAVVSLRSWLEALEGSQREKLAALEATWADRLGSLDEAQQQAVQRLVRKAINSKKLVDRREALLARLLGG